MKTYYIEIERQGNVLWVVRVEANSYQEAELKALKAIHMNDDIYAADEDSVKSMLENGEIDYIIDEDGCEIDIDELEDEEELTEEKFIVYMQDESGFENDYEYNNQDEAIAEAIRIWNNGDGGFQKVSVHQVRKEQSVEDICKENQIWYADHHM